MHANLEGHKHKSLAAGVMSYLRDDAVSSPSSWRRMLQVEGVTSSWSRRAWSLWPSGLCASLTSSRRAAWTTRRSFPHTSTETTATGCGRRPRGEELHWWERGNTQTINRVGSFMMECKGEVAALPLCVTAALFPFWQFCVRCGVYLLHQRRDPAGGWRNPGLH